MVVKTKKKVQGSFRQEVSGLLDYISPSVLDFGPKSIQIGSLDTTVMVITHFPTGASEGWLSQIVTMPGVTASMHVNPTDSYSLIESINKAMGVYESRILNGGNAKQMQRAEKGLEDAGILLKKIDEEQQQVSYLTVVLLISAQDKDELKKRVKRVESRLASKGMRGRLPILKQEEGFRSVGAWGILEKDIFDLGARNMPSESIAAAYPFVYSGLNDGEGILLGQDHAGGVVLFDLWKRAGDRTNSNITIMGKPGVGKSATVKKILSSEYAMGTKVIIIDPEREYKELCEKLEGSWIDCGGGGKGRINPLQVRAVPKDDEDELNDEKLYIDENKGTGALALHFQTLRTFFKLYLGNLDRMMVAYLEMALEETYNNFGIDWDTDPSTITPEKWPIILDLYTTIEKKYEDEKTTEWHDLKMMLRSAAVGADSALWNGHTTIKVDSDFVVLDINSLLEADEEILRAQFFNLLGWTWDEISRDRLEKVLLGVDEAYLLADPDEPRPLKFLRNTSKRIRKYEGGILVITHNLIDFLDNTIRRYGQALIDNPTYKIIMGQGEKDIEALVKLMTLSEREIQTLHEGKRGDALFFAGNKRLQVSVEISPFELEMFGQAGGR